MLGVLGWLVIAKLLCLEAKDLTFSIAHDLGSGRFSIAGHVSTELNGQTVFTRTQLASDEETAFRALLKKDGYYRIQVAGDKGHPAPMTAIRARCLVSTGFNEQLVVYTSPKGAVQALSYAAVGDCTDAPAEVYTTVPITFPTSTVLMQQQPLKVPHPVLPLNVLPATAGAKNAPPDYVVQQQQRVGPVGAGPKPGPKPGTKGPPGAPPEEKTWLQKNWLYLLPIAFVLLNRLGQMAPEGGGEGALRR